MIEVNLLGAITATEVFLPASRRRRRPGQRLPAVAGRTARPATPSTPPPSGERQALESLRRTPSRYPRDADRARRGGDRALRAHPHAETSRPFRARRDRDRRREIAAVIAFAISRPPLGDAERDPRAPHRATGLTHARSLRRESAELARMSLLATDWSTISSLVTGAGTLVLAVATFAAVALLEPLGADRRGALKEQRRPLLAQSRLDDPMQKLMFVEGHWVSAGGGRAAADLINGSVYLGISLRNVGSGMAVCQAWAVRPGFSSSRRLPEPAPEEQFRLQTRDLYIPAGRHRHVAGRSAPPRGPHSRGDGRGDRGAGGDHGRAALQRPGRPTAHDHALRADPDRRRVDRDREPPLVPRLGRDRAQKAACAVPPTRSSASSRRPRVISRMTSLRSPRSSI